MSERLKIVLDTDVLINSFLIDGPERRAVNAAFTHNDVYFSTQTFLELENLMLGERFAHLVDQDIVAQNLDRMRALAIFHEPDIVLSVSRDVDDDMLFELAHEVDADVIVSQNLKDVVDVGFEGEYRTAHLPRFLKDLDLSFKTFTQPFKQDERFELAPSTHEEISL